MENFLNFLSNYYIYFLIAAGVLFFALMGLLVDLRKKRDDNVDSVETSPEVPQEVNVPEPPVTEETPVGGPVEDLNPAPPMPTEEVNSVSSEMNSSNVNAEASMPTESEVSVSTPEVDNNPALDSTPVMDIGTTSEPTTVETSQPVNTTEEIK